MHKTLTQKLGPETCLFLAEHHASAKLAANKETQTEASTSIQECSLGITAGEAWVWTHTSFFFFAGASVERGVRELFRE